MKIRLVVDLTSEAARGAIIKVDRNGCYQLLKENVVPIQLTETFTPARLCDQAERALKDLVSALAVTGFSPQQIHLILHAPFYAAWVKSFSSTNSRPIRLTQSLIKRWQATEKSKLVNGQRAILESELLLVSLDGYQLTNPYGQAAKAIEWENYFSLTDQNIIDRFNGIITSAFHRPIDHYHTSVFIYQRLIGDYILPLVSLSDYLFLELGGEITEISSVLKGSLAETVSFPYGTNSIWRELANHLKLSPQQIKTKVELFLANGLAARERPCLELALIRARARWQELFHSCLAQIGDNCFIPRKVLIGGEQVDSDLWNYLFSDLAYSDIYLGERSITFEVLPIRLFPSSTQPFFSAVIDQCVKLKP